MEQEEAAVAAVAVKEGAGNDPSCGTGPAVGSGLIRHASNLYEKLIQRPGFYGFMSFAER